VKGRLDHGRLRLGVGVPGSGRSGFATATHKNPSSGGLACRPDSGVVLRRGDGLQLHRPAAQQCSSLSPFSSSPPLLHPFFFLTNSSSDMAPAPSCPPSPHLPSPPPPPDCGGSKMGYPMGRLCRGGSGFWGQNPQRRHGTGRIGWGRLLVGRLLGFEGANGWLGCGSGGTRPTSRAPALQGGGHGGRRGLRRPPAPRPHGASRGRSQRGRG
jgi:hypothetical protein